MQETSLTPKNIQIKSKKLAHTFYPL